MKHTVRWDEVHGCVRVEPRGEFAPEEVAPLVAEISALFEGRERRHLLVDHTLSPAAVSRATRAELEVHAAPVDFQKLAFFGMTPLSRMVARVVMVVLGRAAQTNFFKTEDDALAWLHDGLEGGRQ